MTSTKYKVEKLTIDKVKKLFVYRKLSNLLKASSLDQNKDFAADIINVQYQIYMLDGYLENQWELNKKDIGLLWDAIKLSLSGMGYDKKAISSMVEEIKDYERIEKNCRKDKWPTKVCMEDFYTTKSCDVRLIRHLIYNAHPDLGNQWKERAWRFYDIITEIHDDIEDVQEDVKTFNGNRFLISILRKGLEKTYKEYNGYLNAITKEAEKYFTAKGDRGQNKQLAAWTIDRSLQTLKLLDTQIKSNKLENLSASLLLVHMK
ncbi:MAG TPA: hypothetical protein VMZ69_10680 [Saprospiraceae bacterium]|nr:hypothetical protein [Saprospiraceae bacterium]